MFSAGSAKLNANDAMMYLMADKLKNCPDKKIAVIGHADNGVNSKANQRLALCLFLQAHWEISFPTTFSFGLMG